MNDDEGMTTCRVAQIRSGGTSLSMTCHLWWSIFIIPPSHYPPSPTEAMMKELDGVTTKAAVSSSSAAAASMSRCISGLNSRI